MDGKAGVEAAFWPSSFLVSFVSLMAGIFKDGREWEDGEEELNFIFIVIQFHYVSRDQALPVSESMMLLPRRADSVRKSELGMTCINDHPFTKNAMTGNRPFF